MKKILSIVICIALLGTAFPAFSLTAGAALSYDGGKGTEEDPYLISEAGQFVSIFTDPANGQYHYLQTADIDLTELGEGYVHAPGRNFQLSGSYRGEIDLERGITHRTVNLGDITTDQTYFGLFSQVAATGVIENIGVTGSITSTNAEGFTGAVAGVNYGTINNCFSTGDISGLTIVGGIAGNSQGNITNCYTTGDITASGNYAGGIAAICRTRGSGSTATPSIQFCYATGNISSSSTTGGIIGQTGTHANSSAYTFTVSDCYFTGLVTGGRGGGILGAAPNGDVSGEVTLILENNYALNPALKKEKLYGYSVRKTEDNYYDDKTFTRQNNYHFVCEGNGYVDADPGRSGVGLTLEDLTGPAISDALVGFDPEVWGFLPEGGDGTYKFPQLITNPHAVPITDTNITNNIGTLAPPAVSSVETRVDGSTVVTIDGSGLNDTATSYTVRVKDAGTQAEIGTASTQTDTADITSLIGGVEKEYLIAVKADNGYRNNGSGYSKDTSFTYKGTTGDVLDTPVISGCTYTLDPETYTVSWSAVNGASSYEVTVGEKRATTEATSLDITGYVLPEAGNYSVTVKAVSATGESLESAPCTVCSYYGGGTGAEGDEYQIYTQRHLNNIQHNSDKHFLVMKDITEPVTEPIPEFSGSLKGNEGLKAITLNIDKTDTLAVGLISELAGTGSIENLELRGSVTVSGSEVNAAGALAGQASASTGASIKNCINKADVTNNGARKTGSGYYYGTGGIIGWADSNLTIDNCENEGAISAKVTANVGGIMGYSNKFSVILTGCVNRGSVTGPGTVGGIAGANYGLIQKSANLHAIIVPEAQRVGGIAGSTVGNAPEGITESTTITECYNAANVIGTDRVGGISGHGEPGANNISCIIEKSFNTGNIYGTGANVSGILGFFGRSNRKGNIVIDCCYDAQKVSMSVLAGIQSTTQVPSVQVTDSYYLNDGTTDTSAFRGTAATPDELIALVVNGTFDSTVWIIAGGYDYPQLISVPYTAKLAVPDTIVNISYGENGTVTPSGTQYVTDGDTLKLTIQPVSGYRIASILFNGAEMPTNPTDEEYIWETSAITRHSTIAVAFEEIPPVVPELNASPHVFNMYETIDVPIRDESGAITDTVTVEGAKGIVFATVIEAQGYTLKEYGVLFSKTEAAPEIGKAGCQQLKAEVPKNSLGQYGILFYGAGILVGETYYTRPYSIYEKDGEQIIIYGDPGSFTPAGPIEE